jgi:hypothetical protein
MSEENPWNYLNDTRGNSLFDRYVNAVIRDERTEIADLARQSDVKEVLPYVDNKRNFWFKPVE